MDAAGPYYNLSEKILISQGSERLSVRLGPKLRTDPKNLLGTRQNFGFFTDAKELRVSKFEVADGGSLFLDETGKMTPEAQVKLLWVIEEGTFSRGGSSKPIAVDVRVLATTNWDLSTMVKERKF